MTVQSCSKSGLIPNGKLLPNLSSSRLFLSAFHFHQPRKFPGYFRAWVWRKFAAENCVTFQRWDWTGVKWSSQSRKTNFLTLPDLAFSFVHKRSGNEITANQEPSLLVNRVFKIKGFTVSARISYLLLLWLQSHFLRVKHQKMLYFVVFGLSSLPNPMEMLHRKDHVKFLVTKNTICQHRGLSSRLVTHNACYSWVDLIFPWCYEWNSLLMIEFNNKT